MNRTPISLFLATAAFWGFACSPKGSGPSSAASPQAVAPLLNEPDGPAVAVETLVVRPRDVPRWVAAAGTVEALATTQVYSPSAGRIAKVYFQPGDVVSEGDPLFDIDLPAAADSLVGRKTVRISAPCSGRTVACRAVRGQKVQPAHDRGLVAIAQVNPIAIVSAVTPQDLTELRRAAVHGPVVAQVMSPNGRVVDASGTLADPISSDSAPGNEGATQQIKSVVANGDRGLVPGQTVRVRFIVDMQRGAIEVPEEAIVHRDTGDFVYVVRQGRVAHLTPVTVGQKERGTAVVERGLSAEEEVILPGHARLREGARVSPLPRR